jgi:hypothetical protein
MVSHAPSVPTTSSFPSPSSSSYYWTRVRIACCTICEPAISHLRDLCAITLCTVSPSSKSRASAVYATRDLHHRTWAGKGTRRLHDAFFALCPTHLRMYRVQLKDIHILHGPQQTQHLLGFYHHSVQLHLLSQGNISSLDTRLPRLSYTRRRGKCTPAPIPKDFRARELHVTCPLWLIAWPTDPACLAEGAHVVDSSDQDSPGPLLGKQRDLLVHDWDCPLPRCLRIQQSSNSRRRPYDPEKRDEIIHIDTHRAP